MLKDLQFALRQFAKTPGFVSVAVLVLALGIGANAAIFSVVEAVILRALPYRNPERLVMVWEKNPKLTDFLAERFPVAIENFVEWKIRARSFAGMSLYTADEMVLTGAEKPEYVQIARVTPDFGELLGAHPILGRMFSTAETGQGNDHVAVLTHEFFAGRFRGDPKIVGAPIELNGEKYTVIGVWPPGFNLPRMFEGLNTDKADVWLPLDLHQTAQHHFDRGYFAFARLRDNVSIAQARAEMSGIAKQLEQEHPEEDGGIGSNVFTISQEDVGPGTRRYTLLLQGAVGFVLLIACANVANLLLARSNARRKEFALRLAIGASRWRLIRQMLCESMLLSFAGGAVGWMLAWWGIKGIAWLAPEDAPHFHELHLDWLALGFTFVVVLLTGVIFGLVPSMDAARRNVNEVLSLGGRSGSGTSKSLRGVLVSGEIALALVLLVGAGLLIRTVRAMIASDPGFRHRDVFFLSLMLPSTKYKTDEQMVHFWRELVERAAKVPGVESVGLAGGMPTQSISYSTYTIEGAAAVTKSNEPLATQRRVSETYFQTMAIPVIRGRAFTLQEVDDLKSDSVVVNQTFAKNAWPGQDPIGKAIRMDDRRRRVVGVVGDARQLGPESKINPEVYLPDVERGAAGALAVRSSLGPGALTAPLSREVWAIDKDQPIQRVRTLDESIGYWVSERRFVMVLLGAFAALALVLAAVGIYGVLAYSVSQRTREIGIRMAVGASAGDVVKLILREGMILTAIGVVVGVAGAMALTRLMQGLLYGVAVTDPGTFSAGVVVLIAASMLAAYLPARRASRLAPLEALRVE